MILELKLFGDFANYLSKPDKKKAAPTIPPDLLEKNQVLELGVSVAKWSWHQAGHLRVRVHILARSDTFRQPLNPASIK